VANTTFGLRRTGEWDEGLNWRAQVLQPLTWAILRAVGMTSASKLQEPETTKYSGRLYHLPTEFLSDISRVHSHRTLLALLGIWASIVALVVFATRVLPHSWFWYCYVPLGFVMAGRQGALLQIVHEGSHYLISKSKRANDFWGNWIAALPVGLTLKGYQAGHMQHHAYTNTVDDLPTDLEKHSVTDLGDRHLYFCFLRDAFGITALRSFFGHNTRFGRPARPASPPALWPRLERLIYMGVVQLVLLVVVFQLKVTNYLLLWVVPLLTFNMLLLRVRGIAEHGLPGQRRIVIETADQGNRYTRSMVAPKGSLLGYFVSTGETLLIGSLSCNFHHEHHLFPNVPFYNLNKIYAQIHEQASQRYPDIYARGYFAAFLAGRHA